jgi:mRNA interferase RelE/StbE
MKADYAECAYKALEDAPTSVRKAVFKQIALLEKNLHHPSLRAKKFDESRDLWQARVNRDWRFYFQIVGDVHYVVDIIPHPKLTGPLQFH